MSRNLLQNGSIHMDDILPPDQPDDSIVNQAELTLQAAANAAENLIGNITMVGVNSADIAAAGYDPVNFQAQIQFTNGRIYRYSNVSPLDWEGFITAPSKGKYFWNWRRNPVQYPCTRLQ